MRKWLALLFDLLIRIFSAFARVKSRIDNLVVSFQTFSFKKININFGVKQNQRNPDQSSRTKQVKCLIAWRNQTQHRLKIKESRAGSANKLRCFSKFDTFTEVKSLSLYLENLSPDLENLFHFYLQKRQTRNVSNRWHFWSFWKLIFYYIMIFNFSLWKTRWDINIQSIMNIVMINRSLEMNPILICKIFGKYWNSGNISK